MGYEGDVSSLHDENQTLCFIKKKLLAICKEFYEVKQF